MPVVMGTAGHIDHGKTTLVRALTGTDCDRLQEEKRRGITIELGFAELGLPNGKSVSVVDVPGHEKFVRTMVAGAAGVDCILLVIAADEGVMPQTREHLEICSLLGIRHGIVALTKTDAVDEEMIELAKEDIADFLAGSVLEGAKVLPVSAQTGQGLAELAQALAEMENSLAPLRSHDLFRLPIDRIFTLHGHGTVVTGTMLAGTVSVGETVCLYPSALSSKVRGLQSHGGSVQTALAGRRTAVNIPDLAVEDIHRGEVMSKQDMLFPTQSWVLELNCLASSPRALRHRAEVHFHHGARELQARLYFTDRDKLLPGDTCLCEVRFSEPAVAVFGDRCVIRSFSPLRTVAGALVLCPLEVDMRRRSKDFAKRCEALLSLAQSAAEAPSGDEAEKRILTQLQCVSGADKGISFAKLRVLTCMDSRLLDKSLAALSGKQQVFCFDKDARLFVSGETVARLMESCTETIDAFHKRHSEMKGIKRGELLSGWGKTLPQKLSHFILERMLKQNTMASDGEFLHLPSHTASFSKDQAPLSDALLLAYRESGLTPPNQGELLEKLGVSKKEAAPVLAALRTSKQLVRVAEGIWYAREHLEEAEKTLRTWFEDHESIDLAELRTLTGLSRKYLIALLEYFDAEKITIRVGDTRILRSK